MKTIKDVLLVKTDIGGVARYENDYYHRVGEDIKNVPGNPRLSAPCSLHSITLRTHIP